MNRIIGHQKDLYGAPEVPLWSSGHAPKPRAPRARKTDPSTSHEAAAKAKLTAAGVDDRIFDAIDTHGPMTSHEIADKTGISLVSVSPRIKPMRLVGILKDTGARRNGRKVWGIA